MTGPLHRLWTAIKKALQPVWRVITRWSTWIKETVSAFVHGVRERHARRLDTDPSYPVALATGSTAVIGVLAASPAIAAAIGVLVGELVGASERRNSPFIRPRSSNSWSPRRSSWEDEGQRLWDQNDWDE
jgi:hypothetical protein